MERLNALNLSEWVAVGCSGLFAGAAYFINAVDIPAIRTVSDTTAVRQYWKRLYLGGKAFQRPLLLLSTAAGIASWYLSESEYRWLFLVGSGSIFSAGLFTRFFMMSDINKLLKDDVISERGEKWVRDQINVWNFRHMYRTIMSILACNIFMLGVFLNK